MEVYFTLADGSRVLFTESAEEIKSLLLSQDEMEVEDNTPKGPGIYAVADGWTPRWFTTGKYYPIYSYDNQHFETIADDGIPHYCWWKDCPHLDGGNWRKVIVEWKSQGNDHEDDTPKEPGVYAVADGCTPNYLTTGKYYKIMATDSGSFKIVNDDGDSLWCLLGGCAHLDGGEWRKVVVK